MLAKPHNPADSSGESHAVEILDPGPVPRVRIRDATGFYEQFVLRRRPAILVNAVDWPQTSRWSAEMFKEDFGDRPLRIKGKHWSTREFIERVEASTEEDPAPYLNGFSIPENFPELVGDLQPHPAMSKPNWLMSERMPERFGTSDAYTQLLIGGRGTRFPSLHYDQDCLNAIITQIVGSKDFFLFAPEDTPYVYPRSDNPNRSQIPDIHEPDLERFPEFSKATLVQAHLREGETIFVPWGWWHTTKLPGVSIAVTINSANAGNWKAFTHDFGNRRGATTKRLLVKWLLGRVGAYEKRRKAS